MSIQGRSITVDNLKINSTTVAEANKQEFFEIEDDKVEALSFSVDRSQQSAEGGEVNRAP